MELSTFHDRCDGIIDSRTGTCHYFWDVGVDTHGPSCEANRELNAKCKVSSKSSKNQV